MHYQVVSFNYRKCELNQREKLAFADSDSIKSFLNTLMQFDFMLEAFVVNTCNRVEVITASKDNFATFHAILGLLSRRSGINFYELEKTAQRFEDEEAVEHLFSVVSSLDSLVIGEAQITGQVKQGFKLSMENGTVGKELERLLNHALKCAAEVRRATELSKNPVSIASVAVAQAQEIMNGSLAGMTGVVVGSGEIGRLTAKHLLRSGADVVILSRNRKNSQKLAEELGENARVDDFDKLNRYINRYRLLFSATSSPEPIITKEMVEDKDINRVWFDMAIPRDIDDIDGCGIKIYRIDDLQNISKSNYALRKEQALKAAEIVDTHKSEYFRWLQALSVEPVIKQMRLDIDKVIDYEINRAIKKGYIPQDYKDNIEYLLRQTFDKYLHQPTKNLRVVSKESEGGGVIEAIKTIFDIDTTGINPYSYKNSKENKKDTQE